MNSYLDVIAPFDGAVLGRVPLSGPAEAEQALAQAHALFKARGNWLPASMRAEIFRRAAQLLSERAEVFALAAAREGGKPLIDSRVEVARACDGLLNCAEMPRSEPGHVVPMDVTPASAGRMAFTQREPIGLLAPTEN